MNTPHSPEWYDRQYNNRALIPEHPAILQGWADRSASARTRLRDASHLDVPYTARGASDPGERLDIFLPRAGTPRPAPVLVHIHGGYWRALDKRDQSFVAEPFVDAGALVVVPNYTLCPAVTIDAIVMQMVHAVAWTWRHAHEYGADAARIVVAGHSAGGHLAAMMQRCLWPDVADDLPANLVRCAVSISGLFDLEPLRHAAFLAGDLRLTEASARRLSPAWMPAPAGTLVALVGERETDEFRRQNRLIRERWGLGVVTVCEEVPGRHHLDILDDLVDPAQRMHRLTLDALGLG
jgi:arylformamidase